MTENIDSQEYVGPSKSANAFASGALWGQLAVVPQLFGKPIASVAVAVAGLVGGGIWGWNQADKAERQFMGLKERVKDLTIENEKLKADAKWSERLAERSQEKKEADSHYVR